MMSLCKRIDFDTKCIKNIGQLVKGLFILDEKKMLIQYFKRSTLSDSFIQFDVKIHFRFFF